MVASWADLQFFVLRDFPFGLERLGRCHLLLHVQLFLILLLALFLLLPLVTGFL